MKKTVLLVMMVTLIFGSLNLSAAGYGVKAGVNLSNFSSYDAYSAWEKKARTGISIGGFAEFELSENLSVQPEALFSMKGINEELGGLKDEYKLTYFEIPVLLKYKFGGESMKPYLLVGPSFGIKMSAKYKEWDGAEGDLDGVKGLDFGLALGVGAEISQFLVEARYTIGLSKLADGSDAKNSVLSVLIGYKF